MTMEMWFEVIGYTGSLLILVSMLMTSVVKLRIINMIGSAVFTVYAILIGSYPTAFLNGCLVVINVFHLVKQWRTTSKSYEIHTLTGGDGFTGWFLKKYEKDIAKCFPGIDLAPLKDAEGYAVFFDDQAAGVILGHKQENTFEILLDYTTPVFRDGSAGAFLYQKMGESGIDRLSCETDAPGHIKYMQKSGFLKNENGVYVKELGR